MKLIKFLLKLVIFVLILVIIIVGAVWIAVSDSTDDAPLDLYDSSITLDNEMATFLDTAFNEMGEKKSLDIDFTKDELNKIIYGVIRKNINPEYDPKNGTTDEEKYINSSLALPNGIPVFGGKKVIVKNAYAELTENGLNLFVTFDALSLIKTRVAIGFDIAEKDDLYELTLTKMTFGKINLLSSLGKTILNKVLSATSFSEEKINQTLKEQNLPLVFSLDDMSFTITKDDISELLKNMIVEQEETQEVSTQNTMFTELLEVLTNKEYEMIKVGTFKSSDGELSFGAKIDLNKLVVDESKTTLDEEISKPFNQELYITNKTQTFIMNNLASSSVKKMTFTELEFNKLIFNETNGYEGFNLSVNVYGDTNFTFSIDGIIIELNKDEVLISIIMNINGVKTVTTIPCAVEQTVDTQIKLILPDKIKLGDTIEVNSAFVADLLSSAIGEFPILEFDSENDCFLIKADSFNAFMSQGGDTTPLEVSKLELGDGVLNAYVSFNDPDLEAKINAATEAINLALSTTIDTSTLDISSQEEKAKVEKVEEKLNEVKEILSTDATELTDEVVTELITSLTSLNESNQNALLEQISETASSNELEELYNQLFGK